MHVREAMKRTPRRGHLVLAREPNGRPSRAQAERETSPTEVRRLRDAALRGLRDAEWGTEIGRLFLEGAITGPQYAAGKRWRDQAVRYRGSIGVFPIRSLSSAPAGRAEPPDPDSIEGKKQVAKDFDAAETFFEAHTVLVWGGRGAEMAVRKLCEDDENLSYSELQNAKCGLTRLADFYQLTRRAKSG